MLSLLYLKKVHHCHLYSLRIGYQKKLVFQEEKGAVSTTWLGKVMKKRPNVVVITCPKVYMRYTKEITLPFCVERLYDALPPLEGQIFTISYDGGEYLPNDSLAALHSTASGKAISVIVLGEGGVEYEMEDYPIPEGKELVDLLPSYWNGLAGDSMMLLRDSYSREDESAMTLTRMDGTVLWRDLSFAGAVHGIGEMHLPNVVDVQGTATLEEWSKTVEDVKMVASVGGTNVILYRSGVVRVGKDDFSGVESIHSVGLVFLRDDYRVEHGHLFVYFKDRHWVVLKVDVDVDSFNIVGDSDIVLSGKGTIKSVHDDYGGLEIRGSLRTDKKQR